MTDTPQNPDPTIRNAQVNVPHSTTPRHPPRHQPNTPINKKFTAHEPPPKKHRRKTKKDPDVPPPDVPEETNNEPTEIS